jgi:membrane-bound lytic murein transglycosylase B
MDRRALLTGIPLSLALPRFARAGDFNSFLAALQARAAADGIPQSVIQQTTANLVPNADVLKFDHHQAEFTETWATYSSHVLSQARVQAGVAKASASQNLLAAVTSRFGVGAGPLLGIWGIETNYGTTQGNFDVIDALTTLAWDRNSSFFSGQVIDAMRIVANGDAPAANLIGSYAGAMGQPQFMPSVYLLTAISFTGNGQPDIWNSDADTLASMGNYLAKAGWQPGLPSSEPVLAPAGMRAAETGRANMRTLGYWEQRGVTRLPGALDLPGDTPAAVLLPDGPGGEAFLVYENFKVIRRYNASDYYALAVGALGRMVLSA